MSSDYNRHSDEVEKSYRSDDDYEEDYSEMSNEEEESETESIGTDSESDEEPDDDKFWNKAINDVYNDMQEEYETMFEKLQQSKGNVSTEEVEKKTFEKLKPLYNNKLRQYYLDFFQLMTSLRNDPTHRKVMNTAKRLHEDEDYDEDESVKYAVKKRKFLIKRKMDEYDPPQIPK